jgi:hypothetical protein
MGKVSCIIAWRRREKLLIGRKRKVALKRKRQLLFHKNVPFSKSRDNINTGRKI